MPGIPNENGRKHRPEACNASWSARAGHQSWWPRERVTPWTRQYCRISCRSQRCRDAWRARVARNAETGLTRKTTTNDEGVYGFPALPQGDYELQIEHPGFQPFKRVGVVVNSNAALRVDVQLILRPQAEAVTVSESPTQVETNNTQMGELIAASKLASIPVNGHSYTDLLALQPGVIPASSQQPNAVVMSGCTSAPPSGDLNPGNISVSGQRETANGFMVNGSSAQEDFNMGAGDCAESRLNPRIPRADQQLRRRAWQLQRRTGPGHDQVGHQRTTRKRV